MLDFMKVSYKTYEYKPTEVFPSFQINRSTDLMIKGSDFYAIFNKETGLWSTDELDAVEMIDKELDIFVEENKELLGSNVHVKYMRNANSGSIDSWHSYCQRKRRDWFVPLNSKIIFADKQPKKEDYASFQLPYSLKKGPAEAYTKLVGGLYSDEERHKFEWAIGAVLSGKSVDIQKFIVFYGSGGTGKSTVIDIVESIFTGYTCTFRSKDLAAGKDFALEPLKSNALVAYEHDGSLNRLSDNTLINSIVSHETMVVNEKHKSQYSARFNCFIFLGTNEPVKITNAKSGLIRRLIDVHPTGNTFPRNEYFRLKNQLQFEVGEIAQHCLEVFESDPDYYSDYIPKAMMGATNDFYNFIFDSYFKLEEQKDITLKEAWSIYKDYNAYANVSHGYSMRVFKEELKNYFESYFEQITIKGKGRLRSYYQGFKTDLFKEQLEKPRVKNIDVPDWIRMEEQESIFDTIANDYPAQEANAYETPSRSWESVKTTLGDIHTKTLHYVKVPVNHIVIDFDLKDDSGQKSLERNLKEASQWPSTYAELSKSGQGVHLHYIYEGDPTKLSRIFSEGIEVKVFTGNMSLRRKLTKCNKVSIKNISSGLPLKEEIKMVNFEGFRNERALRTFIARNLMKEYHSSTKQSVDFIFTGLDQMYRSGKSYDVSDMLNDVMVFASNSTHQAEYCLDLVSKMQFKSDDISQPDENEGEIVIFDIEVFPNLLLVNFKRLGDDRVVRMINPDPVDVERLFSYKLVGFNCRRYDNHILYARSMGYSIEQCYQLSQRIIAGDRKGFFSEAYNVSYTDVYDFCSTKQSLKKWEIQLGISHKELGLPWDEPVPEEKFEEVALYCDNDVIATEAVFNKNQADFAARKIQVALAKSIGGVDACVNDTTNDLSKKIIFGKNKHPQDQFNYRNLALPVHSSRYEEYLEKFGPDYKFRVFNDKGLPEYRDYIPGEVLPEGWSILPFFPGYKFGFRKDVLPEESGKKATDADNGKISVYMGEVIGEGGRVYAVPGIYENAETNDIASQHPTTMKVEVLFGRKYTDIFSQILQARIAIKHEDFETAGSMLGGALKPYLNPENTKGLAKALKIVINSIYGLTSASFPNPFKDDRNVDNIVAKRGALFMQTLKDQVEKQGYFVAHIKTDSIKIPNTDEYIRNFIYKFGKEYGYTFEIEAEYEKFCLVNDAVYIAKEKNGEWSATGTQFRVPYVFKTLFSKEPIIFDDYCETKAVNTALYLDVNEGLPDVSSLEKERDKLVKKLRTLINKKGDKDPDEILALRKEIDNLDQDISKGHDYRFIGKVGRFTPVKPGCGGGTLYRIGADKVTGRKTYSYAAGSSGYLWKESDVIKELGDYDCIDKSYFTRLADEAIETISKYGDFEKFAE